MLITNPGAQQYKKSYLFIGLLLCSFAYPTNNTITEQRVAEHYSTELAEQTVITPENSILLFDLNDTIVTAATTTQILKTAQNGLFVLPSLSRCLCNTSFLTTIFSAIRAYHSLDAVFEYLQRLAPQRQKDLQTLRTFIADNLAGQFLDPHNALALQQCHTDKKYPMAIFSNMGDTHFQVLDTQYPMLKQYFDYKALGHKASCWTEDNPYWCHKQEPYFYKDFEQQLTESDAKKIKILFDDNIDVINYAAKHDIIGVYIPHYTMLPQLINTITSGHCTLQDIVTLNQFHKTWSFKAPLFCKNHPLLVAGITITGYNLCTEWLSKNSFY